MQERRSGTAIREVQWCAGGGWWDVSVRGEVLVHAEQAMCRLCAASTPPDASAKHGQCVLIVVAVVLLMLLSENVCMDCLSGALDQLTWPVIMKLWHACCALALHQCAWLQLHAAAVSLHALCFLAVSSAYSLQVVVVHACNSVCLSVSV